MPNSFDKMITRLQNTDELRAEFHRFSSDESEVEDEDHLEDDDDYISSQEGQHVCDLRERFRHSMLKKFKLYKPVSMSIVDMSLF